ncbi:MAG: FAD-dependent oxidoreductase, partial [Synergistaceae bacterium]|nr:FAD-dependent oxidoreductase [Synergistaceae bacterium]
MNVLKSLRYIFFLAILLLLSVNPAFSASRKPKNSYDIIIAGGGTGGISAAIQAARMGASVLVVEPSTWIGGQATAAGVSTMDDMSRQKSGIYLDFINRIKNYYDSRGKSMGTCYWNSKSVAFEPHIGQEALVALINEARRRGTLEFLMNSQIISVQKNRNTITGITAQLHDRTQRKYGC